MQRCDKIVGKNIERNNLFQASLENECNSFYHGNTKKWTKFFDSDARTECAK